MSFINTTNTDGIQFTLTNKGKEEALKHGLFNVIKYFTVSDEEVIYGLNVEPNNIKDINGSHTTSTNVSSPTSIITIIK